MDELDEGDYSRNIRAENKARDAALIASGRVVWKETNLRGAMPIDDARALELGKALEKASRRLEVAEPKDEFERENLDSVLKHATSLHNILKDKKDPKDGSKKRSATLMRLEPILLTGEPSVDGDVLLHAIEALKAAAQEARTHKGAASALRTAFGSPSIMWVRRLAKVYLEFTGKKAAQGGGSTGPFFRFVVAAAQQGRTKNFKLALSARSVKDALKKV